MGMKTREDTQTDFGGSIKLEPNDPTHTGGTRERVAGDPNTHLV